MGNSLGLKHIPDKDPLIIPSYTRSLEGPLVLEAPTWECLNRGAPQAPQKMDEYAGMIGCLLGL